MEDRSKKRKKRVRSRIFGTREKPRLSIYRSNKYIYAQLIDDVKGVTFASIGEGKMVEKGKTKTERSRLLGIALAKLAMKRKIVNAVFDRNGYRFHGRVKAFAGGVLEGGLKI